MTADTCRPIIDELVTAGMKREAAERFMSCLHQRTFHAKDFVFRQGDVIPSMVFVLSGYMRVYSTDEGGDISVRYLGGPGDFVACPMATMYASPAYYTAECLTDAQVIVIGSHIQSEIRKEPRFRLHMQDIIVRRLMEMMQEKAAMLPLKATDRYLYFVDRYPRFVKHIPAATIANYIGVRPQSLSRIRQSLK